MKAIKNINNNVSICLDSAGNEVVVFGKGIGFKAPPYDIDLSRIERTYYDIDKTYISMINDIPENVINVSDKIVNYARQHLTNNISSNIVFTLADHINFAINRYNKNLDLKLPILYDVEQLFPQEMNIGKYALSLIKTELNCYIPNDEAAYIALHIINAEENSNKNTDISNDKIITDITEIIEQCFGISINKDNFNYSRFVSHLHYLLKRGKTKELVKSDNEKIFKKLTAEYPKAYTTSNKISEYLKEKLSISLNDEEKLYLILHINRLCTREDCYL